MENVTNEEPKDSLLQQQLSRLSVEALREWLSNMGYKVDESVQKPELIEAVMKRHSELLEASDKTVAKAVDESEDPDDPIIEMVFENVECPGAELEFCYQPPKGEFRVVNGKVRPAPKWHFFPGRKYKVPLSVYRHINSLQVPADKRVNVNETGFITSLYSGEEKQNRFSCRLEITPEQVRRLKE